VPNSFYLQLFSRLSLCFGPDVPTFIDGYINEAGTLNTRRLQQVLDEMAIWEREVFEREYADANWYKGKQRKYVEGREVAEAQARAGLGVFLSVPLFPP
jgi:hypothetical protein